MSIFSLKKNLLNYPLWIFIFSVVSIRGFLTDKGFFNLPFLILAGFSPIVMFKYYHKRLYNTDMSLLIMWLVMLYSSFLHYDSFKVETIFYTLFFILSYMSFMRGIKNNLIPIIMLKNAVKWLIFAYWIVLFIQELCVIAGLPIFNLINTNITGFKLNSLAIEPSNTARYVLLLMIGYISLREVEANNDYKFSIDFVKDKWVWIAFFYLMLFMGSVSAIMFIPFVFLRFIKSKNIIPVSLSIIILFIIASFFREFTVIERSFNTFSSIITFDEYEIMEADGSGATRIAPIIIYLKNIDFCSIDFWFGHGMDGHIKMFTSKISEFFSSVPTDFAIGGLAATFVNFGFLSSIILMIFLFQNCIPKNRVLDFFLIFILVILPSGLNTLITWAAIMMLSANKYFYENRSA